MKRNRSEHVVLDVLLTAAGVLFTVGLITVFVIMFRSGKNVADTAVDGMNRMASDMRDADILQYDGLTVRGADVVNFYKKYLGDCTSGDGPFTVTVDNGTASLSYTDGTSLSKIRDASDTQHYVKSTGQYAASVVKNANGAVVEVKFTAK